MTSGQKIAFSLLTTLLLFSGFVFLSYNKFIPELEINYYEQAKINEKAEQLTKIAESSDLYISNILNVLQDDNEAYLKSSAISSYVEQNPSEKDVVERRKLTEKLFQQIPSIDGIRLIDKNGRNVHFSTYDSTDIFKQTGITKVYKNYTDIQRDAGEIEFTKIKLDENKPERKIFLDDSKKRIILSLPFYWKENIYAGCMVFYINVLSLENALVDSGAISLGCGITMIIDNATANGGFVIGIPSKSRSEFVKPIVNFWKANQFEKKNNASPERILQIDDKTYWVALGAKSKNFIISGVYQSNEFELSQEVIYLIYICAFVTLLLIIYLLFSIKSDSMVTLKKRIKKIQYSIVKEYINNKEDVDWNKVVMQLKSRRIDLTTDIIKSLHVHSKKKRKELDELLEKNWDEIFAITGSSSASKSYSPTVMPPSAAAEKITGNITLDEIRKILEEVLQNTKINVQSLPVSSVNTNEPVDDVEEIDEVEEIEEAEEVEEISDAEEVEEIEEAEEVEEISDAEEVEEIEEAEEVEEISDAEEVEEIEELEDLEEIEEVEEPAPHSDVDMFSALLPPSPAEYEFIQVDDSFIETDLFPTTENVFGELLELGELCSPEMVDTGGDYEFTVYELDFPLNDGVDVKKEDLVKEDTQIEAEVEELAEEVPESDAKPYFSMTNFANNVETAEALEGTVAETIVEDDGVFSISENVEYNNVVQDPAFKALVDSVLH